MEHLLYEPTSLSAEAFSRRRIGGECNAMPAAGRCVEWYSLLIVEFSDYLVSSNQNTFLNFMANVNLPKVFEKLLKKNQELQGVVKTTTFDFGDILEENKLFFFEEYTDHGIKHIEKVLFGTANLITDDTYSKVLKPEDIGFYILAVLLHDIGMHISYEGFLLLINGAHDTIKIDDFDKKTWSYLWEEYLSEAKRFSGKQLFSIFGDEDTIIRNPLSLKKSELTGNDKKLIGEFVRRFHPRLAHEIALTGFPGKEKGSVSFAGEMEFEQRNLIGLIARSHGVNLRKCVKHIEVEFEKSKRTPLGVHASYLMILLRLADYLQVDKSRTSKIVLTTKTFDSPFSKLEHETHLAVEYIDDEYQDDPERIYFSCSPDDSTKYLKLKKLFDSIQNEFDISWAVLGELYGNMPKKPEIKFRRISSNLEDEKYIDKQNYIGDYFTFKSNDEIIRLLISPLYGNHPKFGVRELVQNAVDACKEREEIESADSKYEPFVNVQINSQDEDIFFEIRDNGKGMEIDEIKNYFLSAGASYRKSKEWKEMFINEKGRSKVERNGRFGIGVLATFLIGNNIEVATRKYNSSFGYVFKTNLNTNQINILKDDNLEVGTHIKVKITNEIFEIFNSKETNYKNNILWFHWYTLSHPKIKYEVGDVTVEPYKKNDPHYSEKYLPLEWHEISVPSYNRILWTYSKKYSDRELVLNGIVVPIEDNYNYNNKVIDLGLIRHRPHISIFDNDGITPVSLNRNELTTELNFGDELAESIYKDVIARLLTFEEITSIEDDYISVRNQILPHSSLIRDGGFDNNRSSVGYGDGYYDANEYGSKTRYHELLVSKNGFIMNYNYFIKRLDKSNLVYIQKTNYDKILYLDIKDNFILISNDSSSSIDHFKTAIVKNFGSRWDNPKKPFYSYEDYHTRIFLRETKYDFLFRDSKRRMPDWLDYMCEVKENVDGWLNITLGKPAKNIIPAEFLKSHGKDIQIVRISPLFCETDGDKLFNSLLEKYIGNDCIIPFEMEERKAKYPLAFRELSTFMEKYTSNKWG